MRDHIDVLPEKDHRHHLSVVESLWTLTMDGSRLRCDLLGRFDPEVWEVRLFVDNEFASATPFQMQTLAILASEQIRMNYEAEGWS